MGTLRDYEDTLLLLSHSVTLRMKNISEKVVEKITTHILCSVTLFEKRL